MAWYEIVAWVLMALTLLYAFFGPDPAGEERERALESLAAPAAERVTVWLPRHLRPPRPLDRDPAFWETWVGQDHGELKPPRPLDRHPAFWETWVGQDHGSLYKVLAVDSERVCYLVMWQGNPHWREQKPPGTVTTMMLGGWNRCMEYAPEWNNN